MVSIALVPEKIIKPFWKPFLISEEGAWEEILAHA